MVLKIPVPIYIIYISVVFYKGSLIFWRSHAYYGSDVEEHIIWNQITMIGCLCDKYIAIAVASY